MKKLLAICSIFFTVCATLTGCGDNNDGHYTDDGNGAVIEDSTADKKYESTADRDDKTVRDHVRDAADGVGDAGKDIVDGAGDAGKEAIDGVKDARQYTVPVEDALQAVRDGLNPQLTVRQKHTRECWVVAEDGADTARIEKEIKEMPNYFSDYDTTVHFISEEELLRDHRGLPHGGSVIYSGQTGDQKHVIEFSLKLDSNPEFTGSVLAAAARAAWRMNLDGQSGAKTMFDIAPKYLSPCSDEWLRAHYL